MSWVQELLQTISTGNLIGDREPSDLMGSSYSCYLPTLTVRHWLYKPPFGVPEYRDPLRHKKMLKERVEKLPS